MFIQRSHRPVTHLGLVIFMLAACAEPALSEQPQCASVVASIRTEAVRSSSDPEGRPLPLASRWGSPEKTWAPDRQLELIEGGHHLLPWFEHPWESPSQAAFVADYEAPLKKARKLGLPIVILSTQWERRLSDEPAYLNLPADKNPNVVTIDGKILKQVCPFGPVEPWREVGTAWTNNPRMKQLQQWYPDPPLVVFLSNNEHGKLRWTDAEQSNRYVSRYGKGQSADFKRRVIADGWIERYRVLQQGMRGGLDNQNWRERAIFVGYDAFGPTHFGRWPAWDQCSEYSSGRISSYPLMWDGGSPSYYTHTWNASMDFTLWSPQVEFMNLVFMQREALNLNPEFWFEISTFDGNEDGPPPKVGKRWKRDVYAQAGQTYNPERYGGFVQYGMWLMCPRVVREFRYLTQTNSWMPYFMKIVEAVDRVYTNDVLREFWRKGELVANCAHKHPYQSAIPAEYRDKDRWFLLDASVNPKEFRWTPAEHMKGFSQEIPVFSLALTLGQAPTRRWLLYAHSPLKDRKDVGITIPGYRTVTVDVLVGGCFYLLDEKSGRVDRIAKE